MATTARPLHGPAWVAGLLDRVRTRAPIPATEVLAAVRAGYRTDPFARILLLTWSMQAAPTSCAAAWALTERWREEAPDDWVVASIAAQVADRTQRTESLQLAAIVAHLADGDALAMHDAAVIAGTRGEPELARARWRDLHVLHPGGWEDLEVEATLAIFDRRWEDLEKIARREVALRPDVPTTHLRLAVALQRQSRAAEAKPALDRANALDPTGLLGSVVRRVRFTRFAPVAPEDRRASGASRTPTTMGGLIDPEASGVRVGWLAVQLARAVLVGTVLIATVAICSGALDPRGTVVAVLAVVAAGTGLVAAKGRNQRGTT